MFRRFLFINLTFSCPLKISYSKTKYLFMHLGHSIPFNPKDFALLPYDMDIYTHQAAINTNMYQSIGVADYKTFFLN